MKLFLSHSSKDKSFVRRLNIDLKSHNFQTWLDEEDIPFGGSISQHVQAGLQQSNALLLFISKYSILSTWAATEWQAKLFQQINENKILVIPLRLDDCELPLLLRDKRYVDFRKADDYERNLSLLLQFLSAISVNDGTLDPKYEGSILAYTKELLEELSAEHISLPTLGKLPIVQTLAQIPRSGKQLRLHNFEPTVKIRTIYDHLLSVAHVADCLLPHIDHGVSNADYAELARCIAFHELNEVILGDIPTYTPLGDNGRINARVYAELRLRRIPPRDRERIANQFIWLFLDEKHQKSIDAVTRHLSDGKSRLAITFTMLDKIDPIIATWRYLHVYRGNLGHTPQLFNKAMRDFYENPDIKAYLRMNKVDAKVYELAVNLQDRSRAWSYYVDPQKLFDTELFSIPTESVRKMIEGIELCSEHSHVESRRKKYGKASQPAAEGAPPS